MSDKIPSKFPSSADNMPMFIDYEVDEVAPAMLFFILGVATKAIFLAAVGLLLSILYRKAKERLPNRFMFSFLYHIGLIGRKGSLPGHVKTFLE
jgi:hypothetical protein